jgi:hypothetical protein
LTTLRAVFYNSFQAAVRPIGGAAIGKGSLLDKLPISLQAGTAMLSQANQAPQMIMSLFQ